MWQSTTHSYLRRCLDKLNCGNLIKGIFYFLSRLFMCIIEWNVSNRARDNCHSADSQWKFSLSDIYFGRVNYTWTMCVPDLVNRQMDFVMLMISTGFIAIYCQRLLNFSVRYETFSMTFLRDCTSGHTI